MPAASAPTAAPAPQQRPPAGRPRRPLPRAVAASPPMAQPGLAAPAPLTIEDFTDEPALKDVFFDAGRADIGRAGAWVMRNNARWNVENPGYLILIEGHTDYNGTRESNLAIAERRASGRERSHQGWKAWFAGHAKDFDANSRYRNGKHYSPRALLDHLLDATSTYQMRQLAAEELVIRYGCPVPFEAGRWYFAGQPC